MDDLLLEYCSCQTAGDGPSVLVNKQLVFLVWTLLGHADDCRLESTASGRSSLCRSLMSLTVLD
jgi:hypothetical protein